MSCLVFILGCAVVTSQKGVLRMVWILVLHISAMLFWCAALLYLSSLIVGTAHSQTEITDAPEHHDSMARFVFTHIATPAALLAIIFGTFLFLVDLFVSLIFIVTTKFVHFVVIWNMLHYMHE